MNQTEQPKAQVQALLSTEVASGITQVQTLSIDEDTIALVLRHPGYISSQARDALGTSLRQLLKGTHAENLPIIILEEGMSLEAVRMPQETEYERTRNLQG